MRSEAWEYLEKGPCCNIESSLNTERQVGNFRKTCHQLKFPDLKYTFFVSLGPTHTNIQAPIYIATSYLASVM